MKTVEITHEMLFEVLDKEVLSFGHFDGTTVNGDCARCVVGHLLSTLSSVNIDKEGRSITRNDFSPIGSLPLDMHLQKLIIRDKNYLGAISVYFESLDEEKNHAETFYDDEFDETVLEATINVNKEVRLFIEKRIPKTFSVTY